MGYNPGRHPPSGRGKGAAGMNCSNCGATMHQGPNGDWACGNCGNTSVTPGAALPPIDATLMSCAACGWAVSEGPRGGYVCGQCFHTVAPPSLSTW